MDMWTEEKIQQMIDARIQENIELDYKASASLQPLGNKQKNELIKDISSFANSAGGTIIYTVEEKRDKNGIPVPQQIDEGVDPNFLNREQLEQIIASNSRPRISGLKVFQVPLGGGKRGKVSYVIEIPQSTTAHQAPDGCYYKRLGTTTAVMEHYEIMDVLGRIKTAQLDIKFRMLRQGDNGKNTIILYVDLMNVGIKVIQDVSLFLGPVHGKLFASIGSDFEPHRNPDKPHLETLSLFGARVLFPTQMVNFISPTSPGNALAFRDVPAWYEWAIPWKLYADDMNPKNGVITMKDFLPPVIRLP